MSATQDQFCAIVVTFHTGKILHDCLEALSKAQLCRQIVLVNNGNPASVLEDVRRAAATIPKLEIVDGHGNIGFGRACNLGAAKSTCANLVFVNPDCIIDDTTLAAFAEALSANTLALLGGALRNCDGSEQRGCRRGELTLWSAFVSFSGLGKPGAEAGMWRDFNRNREPFPIETIPIPVVSGALMAVSGETFERVGGFDAAYFLHVEDVDLCARVRAIPGKVLFVPRATALHVGGTSNASNWDVTWAKITSFGHYFWTHAQGVTGRLAVIATMPLLAVAILLRSLLR